MKIGNDNHFSKDVKYKLYRTVNEILHPTISKKNISNYKVVLDETLLPVQVFYPKKVTGMSKVIIAIPGDGNVSGCYGKYTDIYKNMSLEIDTLIIAIDYFKDNLKYKSNLNKIFKVVNYLYNELINNGILEHNIVFMSDSIGCGILGEILLKLQKKHISINKNIWLYPICRKDYSSYTWDEKYLSMNFNLDKKIIRYLDKQFSKNVNRGRELLSLTNEDILGSNIVISGEMDLLLEDEKMFSKNINAEFLGVKFLGHGFLGNEINEEMKEVYAKICDFVKL